MTKRIRTLIVTVLLDAVLINLAFALAYYARYEWQLLIPVSDTFYASYSAYLPFQAAYTVLMLIFLFADGVYAQRRGGSWFNELYRIGNATTTVGVISFATVFFILPPVYSRALILEAVALTIALLSGMRLGLRYVQSQLRQRGLGVERVLIVGAGEVGRAVMRTMVARSDLGYRVVGFVDDDASKSGIGRFKALGSLDEVELILKTEPVDEVIITLPWMYQRKIVGLVRQCEHMGVRARVVPDLFQLSLSRVDFDDVGGIPLIGIKEATISQVGRILKRTVDILVTLVGLLLAWPLYALIALAVRLESPGGVLFKQTRVGANGKLFVTYKFRSMRQGADGEKARLQTFNEADGPLFKIKDDPRLTRVGKWLRRFSLDELPQVLNVLRGEMSLVGPRPALPEEVAQYQVWQRQRLDVLPGMTGLWQVSGRSDLTFDEMCLLDIYYIENWSLGLDFVILLRTLPSAVLGRGAY